jgi:hypothetical protein
MDELRRLFNVSCHPHVPIPKHAIAGRPSGLLFFTATTGEHADDYLLSGDERGFPNGLRGCCDHSAWKVFVVGDKASAKPESYKHITPCQWIGGAHSMGKLPGGSRL